MVRQHHQFNGHEFEQAPEDVEDRGAWHATVHGVSKSQTRLSNFTFTFNHPSTIRLSNQSTLKEINTEYPLEGLMLKLKLQYFGHLMPRANSLQKTLMLAKTEGSRRRGDR